jgi:hypothetical protein
VANPGHFARSKTIHRIWAIEQGNNRKTGRREGFGVGKQPTFEAIWLASLSLPKGTFLVRSPLKIPHILIDTKASK